MIGQQTSDVERKIIAILKILSGSPQPLGGRILARRLGDLGIVLGERAVRYHLRLMDERGLTHNVGQRDGRVITQLGIEELDSALVTDRLGLMATRIEELTCQSSFDYEKHTGEVPVNVSLFSAEEFSRALKSIEGVIQAGFALSDLVAVAGDGEELGEIVVPSGMIGLATVSHIVVYGALLKESTPVDPRFGGVLQIQNREVLRFSDLIEYAGCSLDPTEIFISGKMTSVSQVVREGSGKILASFCEIPAVARLKAEAIIKKLKVAGINGLIVLGGMGKTVCQIPVDPNRVGIVLSDGLNPVVAAAEEGFEVINHHMSGMIDIAQLNHFKNCLSFRE